MPSPQSFLETVEVSTGLRTVLAAFSDWIEAPNWAADGRSLVFNAGGRLYRYDLAQGTRTEVPTGICTRCNNDHVLGPGGTEVAVSHHTEGDGLSRIYRCRLDGRAEPVLVTPAGPSYLHGWSPEGDELAYCAERGGEYDIYTIPAAGGPEKRLTDSPGLNDGPEYSPDGRTIWFNSVRTGAMQIWKMDRDGGRPTQMTFDRAHSWFPHLSPDGTAVAFVVYREGDVAPGDHPPNKEVEIRLMDAGGGPPRTLVRLFGGQGTLNVNSWSPEGTRLAFVSYPVVPSAP